MVGLRMALVGVVHNMKVYMLDNKLLHILLGMEVEHVLVVEELVYNKLVHMKVGTLALVVGVVEACNMLAHTMVGTSLVVGVVAYSKLVRKMVDRLALVVGRMVVPRMAWPLALVVGHMGEQHMALVVGHMVVQRMAWPLALVVGHMVGQHMALVVVRMVEQHMALVASLVEACMGEQHMAWVVAYMVERHMALVEVVGVDSMLARMMVDMQALVVVVEVGRHNIRP